MDTKLNAILQLLQTEIPSPAPHQFPPPYNIDSNSKVVRQIEMTSQVPKGLARQVSDRYSLSESETIWNSMGSDSDVRISEDELNNELKWRPAQQSECRFNVTNISRHENAE